VSPSLDLLGLTSPTLSFWYANESGEEPADQNELRVYYKDTFNGDWTLIPGAVYTTNINNWTKVQLDLPEISEDYYLAFEGTNRFGQGIVLDDVFIGNADDCFSNTIWDGLAWSHGVPDLNTKAVIDGTLVLNSN